MKRTSNSIVQRLITHNNNSHTSSLTKTTRQYFCPRNCVFDYTLSNKPNLIVPNNKLLFYPTTTTFGQIRSYTTTNWWKEKEASTNDIDGTNTSAPSSSEPITLNLMDYESWNAQQVASVLTSPKSLGGAGLSFEKLKPLYEAGFDCSSLHNIVENIKLDGVKYAIDQLQSTYNKSSIPQLSDTCQTVVFWVLDQLMTRQYSLWQLEPVSKQIIQKLGEPIAKGGADLSLDQISSLDSKTLYSIAKDVASSKGESVVIRNLDLNLGTTVVKWAKFLQNNKIQIELKKFTTIPSHFIQSVLNDFDKHAQTYSRNEKDSVLKFNEKMKQFQLDKEGSPIYLYLSKAEGYKTDEITLSSRIVSCDLGPTFPTYKYDEHYKFITSGTTVTHPVLILIEAPGTGKTHFGHHLISHGYTVFTISFHHKKILVDSLDKIIDESRNSTELRGLLDRETNRFIRAFMTVADIIFRKKLKSGIKDGNKIRLYLYKYILNGGFKKVQEAYIQGYESNVSPQLQKVIFLIDEAHDFYDLGGRIPKTSNNGDTNEGNLLTLLASNMRAIGGVILTTTFASAVEGRIETKISKDDSKPFLEKFSYHFTKPLPILHATQVTTFLNKFIDTSRKRNNNSDIWKLVATFLQGPTRRCEEFLQDIYLELKDSTTPEIRSFEEFVYTILCNLVDKKKEYSQGKTNQPLYKSLFYRLALLGEANLTKAKHVISSETSVSNSDEENAARFLLTHGLSYTYDYTNKIYKIVSPIERMRLLKTLQQEASKVQSDWFLYSHKQLSDIGDISPLSEVAAVYFILNHFKFFKQQFPGTYLQNYNLQANYYVEDSEISKDSLSTDFKISSLLINTIHCNMKGLQTIQYPLTGSNKDLLPQFLVRPCHHAGPDVIGMLVRRSSDNNELPMCIPVVAAVTRMTGNTTKFQKNYATTDLSNLYHENLATNISPPTNALAVNERNSLDTPITDIMKTGKILRLLFHPNESFNTPLSDRIPQFSNGADEVEKAFSDHAVLTKKGHLVYEISKNNSIWENYLNSNGLSVLGGVFQ